MEKELTIQQLLASKYRLFFYPLKRQSALGTAQQGTVVLDPESRSPLARTLLHELVHVRRPLWSEARVLKEERKLWGKATWKEKVELFKALGKGRIATANEELEDEEDVSDDLHGAGHLPISGRNES
jgi:hypothetical protein